MTPLNLAQRTNLVVGDVVYVGTYRYGRNNVRATNIAQVTPTRVKTDLGLTFTIKDGREYGATGLYTNTLVTEASYDQIKSEQEATAMRNRAINALTEAANSANRRGYTIEQLTAALAALGIEG